MDDEKFPSGCMPASGAAIMAFAKSQPAFAAAET